MIQSDLVTDNAVLAPLVSAVTNALNSKKVDMGLEKSHLGYKKPLIVALDGCCGSGKTYYSSILAQYFGASVIHCDDFFLPFELRTNERISEIGGNVHYERLAEVLNNARRGKPFTYQAYDCSTGNYVNRKFAPTDVVIVEGSYALHDTLRTYYDVKAVLVVDSETQLARLQRRESPENLRNFIEKWIPLENRYFHQLDTSDCVVINTAISL